MTAARITTPSTNGTAPKATKAHSSQPKTPGKRKGNAHSRDTMPTVRTVLTVALGVAIPLLSLSLSTISGSMAMQGHYALAVAALGLCCSVLAVSLSHLATAIADITHSTARASWALAIVIDLALVLGEFVTVFAPDAGVTVVCTALMVTVCGFSMLLNCWAFLTHKS